MREKLIYFVRHGETESNAKGIRQGEEGSLTERGRAQALNSSRKFPKHKGNPEIIISSPWQRTKETATILSKELNLKIEYSDLLVERRNPSQIIGHAGVEKDVQAIVDRIDKSYHADDLRYSDEENFLDLKERAKKLLAFIKSRNEKKIIMVTHGIFLKLLVAYMERGDALTASEYNTLSFFNPMDNAGLTIVKLATGWFRKDKWEVIVWNDQTEIDD